MDKEKEAKAEWVKNYIQKTLNDAEKAKKEKELELELEEYTKKFLEDVAKLKQERGKNDNVGN